MPMIRYKTWIAMVAIGGSLLLFGRTANAYFQDAGDGVRPAGMGEAFVAVADDAYALIFNSAGLARMENIEVTGMYANLYSNFNAVLFDGQRDHLGYNFVGMGIPISQALGTVGFGWMNFNSVFYSENSFYLGYAHRIYKPAGLDIGINLKMLQWQVGANEYSQDPRLFPTSDLKKTSWTGDVGMMITPFPHITLGGSVENIIPADVGLSVSEIVPMLIRGGISYQTERWLASFEWSSRNSIQNWKIGFEGWLYSRLLVLRAGANLDACSAGLGIHWDWPSSSVGIQIDYAFNYPLALQDTIGSHRVGITIGWQGGTSPHADSPKSVSSERKLVPNVAQNHVQKEQLSMTSSQTGPVTYEPQPLQPPRSVFAKRESGKRILRWVASLSEECCGYNVYGKFNKNGTYKKLNTAMVTRTVYRIDKTRKKGDYYYVVCAVDRDGRESPPSVTIKIQVP